MHFWIPAVRAVTDALLSVLLAPACPACRLSLEHPSQGPVCGRCWQSVLPLTPPLCDRCGDPLPAWRTSSIAVALCPRCRRTVSHVDRTRAVGAYDGALRAIVHALKFEGRRSLARPLAALMRARCADVLADAVWIVPVPLHASRRRQRGFNQAADLARHLGLPVREALRRRRSTEAQSGLPARQRRRNVRGAFTLACGWGRPGLKGTIVVLVDDVSTTGATLDACAQVLKDAAGVREVRALTAARVVTRRQ